jgi:hypothetical protein
VTSQPRSPFTSEELERLKTEIPEKFPNWRFVGVVSGHGEYALGVERVGSIPDRQVAMTPEGLLEAIAWREQHLKSVSPTPPVVVHEGIASTRTY